MSPSYFKYDTVVPQAPTLYLTRNEFSWSCTAELQDTGVDQYVKFVWSTSSLTAEQVNEYPTGVDTDNIDTSDYSRIIKVVNKTAMINFCTVDKIIKSDLNIPWNTQGYLHAIVLDQTYLDEDGIGAINKSKRNYSTVTVIGPFYSSAEYIDIEKLYVNLNIDQATADIVDISLYFDGYPNITTTITSLRIVCTRLREGMNTPVDQNGNAASYVDFTPPTGFMQGIDKNLIIYTLPYDSGNETYSFEISTKNAEGYLSGTVRFDTNKFEEKIRRTKWDVIKKPKIYNIPGYRKRSAIHLSDISIKEEKYLTKGSHISKMKISNKPFYATQLYVNEIFDFPPYVGETLPTNPEVYLRYYLQFIENGTWYRISPQHRGNETWIISEDIYDSNLTFVPKTLILDTSLSDDEQLKNTILKNISYINLSKKIFSCRIRIDMDISSAGEFNNITPKISDYTIKIVTRDVLKANVLEEDIGSA